MAGSTIRTKLILGYQVKMGSRTAANEKARSWVVSNGNNASKGTFEDAAKFADVFFNCTKGANSVDAIKLPDVENLKGKY